MSFYGKHFFREIEVNKKELMFVFLLTSIFFVPNMALTLQTHGEAIALSQRD